MFMLLGLEGCLELSERHCMRLVPRSNVRDERVPLELWLTPVDLLCSWRTPSLRRIADL